MSTGRQETGVLDSYRMTFDGAVLRRGFWLYVWKIKQEDDVYVYIGRTGDSSSPNASSPFVRISQHLDFRPNAKANSMGKHLCHRRIRPDACSFEMLAIGPLFREARDMGSHRPRRDKVGAAEKVLAQLIRERGYCVLGRHSSRTEPSRTIVRRIEALVDAEFPPRASRPAMSNER